MRIVLHIGLDEWGAARIAQGLAEKRDRLAAEGVLVPRSAGPAAHSRLFMAVSDPGRPDHLRANRGFAAPARQAALRRELAASLAREVEAADPALMILSASQFGTELSDRSELERLRDLLAPLSRDMSIVAHVEEPARMLARHYAAQVADGRAAPLSRELQLAEERDWWAAALATRPPSDPANGVFPGVQGAPFWLDLPRLQTHWEGVFGPGALAFRAFDPESFAAATLTDEIRAAFGIDANIGRMEPATPSDAPSAAWLARARQMNDLLLRLLAQGGRVLPRPLWRRLLGEFRIDGPPTASGSLAAISRRFAPHTAALLAAHPGLTEAALRPDPPQPKWTEADPLRGFRASNWLLAQLPRIDKATREAGADRPATAQVNGHPALSPTAEKILPPLAREKYRTLIGTPFAPHNRGGRVDEEALAAAFAPATPQPRPDGTTGNVIVACMKNEAPYILEWIAYHRAIGVDDFLIYSNGCEDGTDAILDRLDALGHIRHRHNDDWTGNSPQQHALNRALKEPVVTNAHWIAHIDVDEFINVRCGNGTLADLFERIPDATHVALTWRLFGHNGVTRLEDRFVIDQFDACAPRFCPKPHTVWGFKTLFRNIGAYEKLSCHRPNKLRPDFEDRVKWVNGSGQDMTSEVRRNGWRNSRRSIGYDLVQLNHYALRSAESFLIKRQRGRALHVDRSIGLGYWIRMDWGDHRDVTIRRNIPRVRAEYDRLLRDGSLARLHAEGLAWHRAKAETLHATPEFADLYRQALEVKLTGAERVAWSLALDTES